MAKLKSNFGGTSVKFNHNDKSSVNTNNEAKNPNHMIRTLSSNRENKRLSQCT